MKIYLIKSLHLPESFLTEIPLWPFAYHRELPKCVCVCVCVNERESKHMCIYIHNIRWINITEFPYALTSQADDTGWSCTNVPFGRSTC